MVTSPKKICVSDGFWGRIPLAIGADKTVASRVANLLAVSWDIIFHSIKMLASGKARKQ